MEILPCNFPVINLSIYVNNNAIIKKFRLEKFKKKLFMIIGRVNGNKIYDKKLGF